MKTTALLFLAAAAIVAPHAATAQTPAPPTAPVRYSDLDLQNPRAAMTMLRRVRAAASDVCSVSAEDRVHEIEHFDKCYHHAVEDAVTRLNAPLVTAAYEGRATLRTFARLP